MLCSCQSGVGGRLAKLTPPLGALSIAALFLALEPCRAQPAVEVSLPQDEWVKGPAKADVGTVAEFNIPSGYKYRSAAGARTFLEESRSQVPANLVGVLSPTAGGWWVVLTYAEIGHLKADAQGSLNPDSILAGYQAGALARQNADRAQQKAAPFSTAAWELAPAYDAKDQVLEWAVRAETGAGGSERIVNHSVAFLGRQGVLQATAVYPYKGFTDLRPIREILSSLVFKAGERYTEYRAGDKDASITLAQVITTPQRFESKASGDTATPAWVRTVLVCLTALVCLGAGCIVAAKLIHKPKTDRAAVTIPAEPVVKPAPNAEPVPAAAPKPSPEPRRNLVASSAAAHKDPSAPRLKPAARNANGRAQSRAARRQDFDYNRYFADLMSAVSGYSNSETSSGGQQSGLTQADAEGALSALAGQGYEQAAAELLATQAALIEEQRRLIQEQTKLIEEKSRLIAEKNHLMKLQAELMERKSL